MTPNTLAAGHSLYSEAGGENSCPQNVLFTHSGFANIFFAPFILFFFYYLDTAHGDV